MKNLFLAYFLVIISCSSFAMQDDEISMSDFYEQQTEYLATHDELTLIDLLNSYTIQLEKSAIPTSLSTTEKKGSVYNAQLNEPFVPLSKHSQELYFDTTNNQCKACGQKCADWSSLNLHCVRNHAVKRFLCEYCAQLKKISAFAYQGDLNQHLKRVHKYITL